MSDSLIKCPGCGKEVSSPGKCPQCGVETRPVEVPEYTGGGTAHPGLPRLTMLLIILLIVMSGAAVFLKGDGYQIMKADRLIGKGKYSEGVDILFKIMARRGPDTRTLLLASEGLLLLGESRMDAGKYKDALPLFNKVVEINSKSEGVGGNPVSVFEADLDLAVCYLKLAQEKGGNRTPFGDEMMAAEHSVEDAKLLSDEIKLPERDEMIADLYFLSAQIAAERADYFLSRRDRSQSRAYLLKADEEFATTKKLTKNGERFLEFSEGLGELWGRLDRLE